MQSEINQLLKPISIMQLRLLITLDSLGGVLSKKTQDVREDVKDDVTRLEYELNRHAAQQKSESSKIQTQIKLLQNEKKSLDIHIMGLQRRISEIEETVGIGINDV